jgi:hypothetical protein
MRARQRHLNPGHFGAAIALDARFGFSQANGSAVSTWEDRTNNNKDASQATAANQPVYTSSGLNGNPVVTFDGANPPNADFLNVSSITVNQPNFVISVWRANGGSNYLFDAISGNRVIIGLDLSIGSGTGKLASFAGTVLEDSIDSSGSEMIATALYNSTSSQIWKNGVSRVSGNANTNNIGSIKLGERFANFNNVSQLNGYIGAFTAISSSSNPIRKRIEHSYGFSFKLACS